MNEPQITGIMHETLSIVQVDKVHMFLCISVKSIDSGIGDSQ